MAKIQQKIRRMVRKFAPTRLRQNFSVEEALRVCNRALVISDHSERTRMWRTPCCYNAAGRKNPPMLAVRLIGVLALIALNGFFAATEFSLVAVRLSRVRQLVAKGNARARVVEALLGDLHRVVSGVQLGITLTSLAIGALGEATLAKVFQSIWAGKPGAHTVLIAHAVAQGANC